MESQETAINKIREFNRFYTSVIGVLDRHILDSKYSLPEARVMYEINRRHNCTAKDIKLATKMDEGYLSRTVEKLQKSGLLKRVKSELDGRAYFLTLSKRGKTAFSQLDKASHDDILLLLNKLNDTETQLLITQLVSVQSILSKTI